MKHTIHRPEIERLSLQHKVDPNVVEAMVLQESGGNQWAVNPEPHYRYLWDVKQNTPFRRTTQTELNSKYPPKDFYDLRGFKGVDADHEWWGQQQSFGLLQLMGAVGRELGFRGIFLTELCNPSVNLDLGCKFFASLMRWAKNDTWQAVAAYNGGRGGWREAQPQAHAKKVKTLYTKLSP